MNNLIQISKLARVDWKKPEGRSLGFVCGPFVFGRYSPFALTGAARPLGSWVPETKRSVSEEETGKQKTCAKSVGCQFA